MTVSALTPAVAKSASLSKLGNGEYSAASVSANPNAATSLGLRKEKDGNYGTANPDAVATGGSAAMRSSSATQAALTGLILGGE